MSGNEERNWAEFDKDMLLLIFQKVGAIDILMHAQYVCKPWRNLSFDPSVWKMIDMTTLHGDNMDLDLEKMTREAVDRSDGQLEELWIAYFGSDSLLKYVEERSRKLKRLRIIAASEITNDGLCEALRRLTHLEELEITFGYSSADICDKIGKACPNLKCFRYNNKGNRYNVFEYDEDAINIANSMPQLRRLQLVGNNLTNKGLKEILDKCKHLERLDIRCCFSVNIVIDANLKAKCAKLKEVRYPDDPTDDYEFVAEVSWDQSYNFYNDDSGHSDIDLYDDLDFDDMLFEDYSPYDEFGVTYNGDDYFDMSYNGDDYFDMSYNGDDYFDMSYDGNDDFDKLEDSDDGL